MLKYGKWNNRHKLRHQVLSEITIKENGNLGKLIEKEKYYEPKLFLPDYTAMGIDAVNLTFMQSEVMMD
jgi:hypothetical protein